MADGEQRLSGGRQTEVVRVGDTIRRPPRRNAEFVQAVLRHFETVGFDGAPRHLGIDDQGRQILTYVEGEVCASTGWILSDARLVSAARLIRRFHDATAGTRLAERSEVVCHNDLGQHNIVFRGDEAVAIIDWDEDVAPGPRLVDLEHAIWCLAEIGDHGGDPAEQAHRVRLLCDAYGWEDVSSVIDEIEARLRRARVWHEQRGFADGARIFGEMIAWLVEHGPAIRAAL